MLTSGEIWWQVYRDILPYFFQLFCTPIFFFSQIIKRRYFTHASRPLKLEENGHVICRQHLRAYFVVPIIQWDYLSDLLRVHKPTNPYSESLGDETQKNSGTRCAGRRAATLRAPPCRSALGILSFRCSYLVSQREFCVIEGGPHQSPPPSEPRKQTA